MTDATALSEELLLTLTSDIVAAHVGNNSVTVSEMPQLIASVHGALTALGIEEPAVEPLPEPAVPIRSSVKPDYIVCLEDGRKMKTLKRHLKNRYDMTPDDYRKRWNLPADYPMVAPGYTARRRELAITIGLGRKQAKAAAVQAPESSPLPVKAAPKKRAPRKSAKAPA